MEESNSRIVIVCACNDKYAPYCGVMLTSVFHNNQRHKIEVYILSSDIGIKNREKFTHLAYTYKQTIEIKSINVQHFQHLPLGEKFTNISYETYFRLIMPSLLNNTKKVLYLDCDIIVRKDLSELWDTDMEGYAIAGIQDTTRMQKKCFPRLGYDAKEGYYNAGVGLYNLEFLRKFNFEKKVASFVQTYSEKIIYHDQDILNYVCHGLIREISPKWNLLESFMEKEPPVVSWQRNELLRWRNNPYIIHYASIRKPWHIECLHPYKHEFWRYVYISPWADLQPTYKYSGLKRWTKYYLKLPFKLLTSSILVAHKPLINTGT